ncbi:Uu.00g111840.m01.CDS01 [Anthostomella pinea]|uniref:Uu.00g111840.m01.CDS01 n=1 Tax=Anthostomella pinea TaxID=933095 RepID=A0AAI8VFV1_9PEZI|nr:Uu.00g111840.m01.CDS01 [Anthostomella pinea]
MSGIGVCTQATWASWHSGFLRGLATLKKYFLKIQTDVRLQVGLVTPHKRHEENGEAEDDYAQLSVSE